MMYIVTKQDQEIMWHVGEKFPHLPPHDVVEIYADGHELEHVQKYGHGLRLATFIAKGQEARTVYKRLAGI